MIDVRPDISPMWDLVEVGVVVELSWRVLGREVVPATIVAVGRSDRGVCGAIRVRREDSGEEIPCVGGLIRDGSWLQGWTLGRGISWIALFAAPRALGLAVLRVPG